ncbi:MAG: hypothetical protein CBD95_005990 [Flavobacteriales bacterium TMED235]|nr:MAG: hypothetical protein CBD95_005990 [Flavobacteriales bacterium TMED235]|tara:strand:+ start:1320 stop:2063 length:744 start_codon:yes stop_codon:yes gene_type:complete
MKKKNIFTIITARTKSKRLPKKCLKIINKLPVIEIIIRRAKKIGYPIILSTTMDPADNILCRIAKKNNINFFRGSKNNVLKRWNDCFSFYKVDIGIIVDADDLLFDYDICKKAVNKITNSKYDYIRSNKNSITGLFNYVFKSYVIKKIFSKNKTKNIETIGPYLKNKFNCYSLNLKKDKKLRLTLDYKEDLIFFKKIFSKFSFTVKTTIVIKYLRIFKKISNINYFRQDDYLKNQKRKYDKLQRLEI